MQGGHKIDITITGRTKRGYKGIYTPKLPRTVPQRDIFLTDIIGYDKLKLYLKIYTTENEIRGTPLNDKFKRGLQSYTSCCLRRVYTRRSSRRSVARPIAAKIASCKHRVRVSLFAYYRGRVSIVLVSDLHRPLIINVCKRSSGWIRLDTIIIFM